MANAHLGSRSEVAKIKLRERLRLLDINHSRLGFGLGGLGRAGVPPGDGCFSVCISPCACVFPGVFVCMCLSPRVFGCVWVPRCSWISFPGGSRAPGCLWISLSPGVCVSVPVCVSPGCLGVSRVFGCVSPSPGVWMREPLFPPASVNTRQRTTSCSPSRAGLVPPAPAAGGPAALGARTPPSRPWRPRPPPWSPADSDGSPRPAHLAATRKTPGSSGPARTGAGRKERGLRTRRAEDGGGSNAALPGRDSTCCRPAPRKQHGDGPGRGPGQRGGAWAVEPRAAGRGPWEAEPRGRGPPRPHPLPDPLSAFNKARYFLGLAIPAVLCLRSGERQHEIIVFLKSLRKVEINRSHKHNHRLSWWRWENECAKDKRVNEKWKQLWYCEITGISFNLNFLLNLAKYCLCHL